MRKDTAHTQKSHEPTPDEPRDAPGLVDPRRETGREVLGSPAPPEMFPIDDNPGEGDAPLDEGYEG